MAEVALGFLLENLKQVLLYHSHLISEAKSQVEQLAKDLVLFKAFLKDSAKIQKKDDTVQALVWEIRDIVYEIEDVIDSYLSQASDQNRSKNFLKKIVRNPLNLIKEAEKVAEITKKVKEKLDRDPHGAAIRGPPANQIVTLPRVNPKVREDNIVGFDEEADNIITYMKEATEELDVISIIGLPGLGKTTLAGKVFRDRRIEYEFPIRIWMYVSQEFKRRDVFLSILNKFISNTDHLKDRTDDEIAQILRGHLDKARFLIVMDDVWSAKAWSELKDAFPKMHKTGKILITSRHVEVALKANQKRNPYKLRFLDPKESLELLQLEVFGERSCPDEDLKPYGRTIVRKCGGLPLAIVVIGGVLLKKSQFGDTITRRNVWRKVSVCVPTYYLEEEEADVEGIIALSYHKLPYYLKPCFLYLGIFAEDFEIPVWTLIRLWIAEGFIQEKTNMTLEQTAEDYLEELVNRNLVMVDKMSTDGKIKTCRLHDTLRQFCKKVSGIKKENILQELKSTNEGFKPSTEDLKKCRRLCIHSNIFEIISSSQLSGPHVRSFVCSSNEDAFPLPAANASSIPTKFKLLRILDAMPVIFPKFPRELARLIHLRYVVLSSNFTVIPKDVSELWNLQSLIIYTSSQSLDIKANIWKMHQLRHVKTNASAILPECGKNTYESGAKLQTLGAISPQSCTEDVFERLRSLRKLGIRGLLGSLQDAHGLEKLDNLDKLKLVNDSYSNPSSGGRLRRLPEHYRFPRNLRSLTLCATYLEWVNMSTLGSLEKLEVLKLKENAFMGVTWEVSTGHFRHLEVLHIERTNLRDWEAEANHFPRLKCLVLSNCEELVEIPTKLAHVPSFQRLDLKRVSKTAADSARTIETEKKAQEEEEADPHRRTKFKLYIAPGDE